MANFRDQLNKAYKNKVLGQLEKTIRAVALVVDSELVNTTPVDTGRARSNWIPSINVVNPVTVEPNNKPSIAPVLKEFKITDTILISNNLPYIRRLNEGSSKQAPAGFVDAAVAKGKRVIR